MRANHKKKPHEELPQDLAYDLLTSIPEEERESFTQQFISLRFVREHMAAYFLKELEAEIRASEETDKYTLPAWAEKQADSIGYRRALRKIIKTLGGGRSSETSSS